MEKDLCDDGPPAAEIYIVFCVCLFSLEKIICQNRYLVFLVKKDELKVQTKRKEVKAPTRRRKQKAKAFVTKSF